MILSVIPDTSSFIILVGGFQSFFGVAYMKLLLTQGSSGPKFVPATHPCVDPHHPQEDLFKQSLASA